MYNQYIKILRYTNPSKRIIFMEFAVHFYRANSLLNKCFTSILNTY